MNATIKKWGNSLALRIPSAIAKDLEIQDGSKVKIELEGKTLKIELEEKFTIDDFMKGLTKENRHEIIDYGIVGKEKDIWLGDTYRDKEI